MKQESTATERRDRQRRVREITDKLMSENYTLVWSHPGGKGYLKKAYVFGGDLFVKNGPDNKHIYKTRGYVSTVMAAVEQQFKDTEARGEGWLEKNIDLMYSRYGTCDPTEVKPEPWIDDEEEPTGEPVNSAHILDHCHSMGINGIEAWCEDAGVPLTWTTLYGEWRQMWVDEGVDIDSPDDVERLEKLKSYGMPRDASEFFDTLASWGCNPQIVDGHVLFGHSDGSEGLFVYENISFQESQEKG